MRHRWVRIGAVVVTLVLVNLAARLIIRLASGASEAAEFRTALASLLAMGLVLAITGFVTACRHLPARTAGDLFFVLTAASLSVTLLGPFASGGTPFGSGFVQWLLQILVCVGALAVGSAIGVLLAIACGLDPKSRAWAAYAAQVKLPATATRPGKAKTKPVKKRTPAKR